MRIHRLRLSHVKGVEDREVAFPGRGVIVLEGANEVGKTTMLEALDVLLEEKDSSRKRHVVGLRPVGRDVPTSIEAELSSGPYHFRYRKQWFRQPATELHVIKPRVEHLTGVAAHERVAAMIAETADVALWRALRLMQAAPLSQVELCGSSALSAALDAAAQSLPDEALPDEALPDEALTDDALIDDTLIDDTLIDDALAGDAVGDDSLTHAVGTGGVPSGEARMTQRTSTRAPRDQTGCPGGDSLVAAAETELARYFTAGRGQPTGEYRAAQEAVAAAAAAERAAAAAVAEVAADVDRHEEVADLIRRAAEALEEATSQAAELEARWDEIVAQEETRQVAQREADAADRELRRARERHEDRARLIADIDDRARAVGEHEHRVAELEATLRPDEELLVDLSAQCDAAQTRLEKLTALAHRADLAEKAAHAAAEVTALAHRLERAETADLDRREVAAELHRIDIDASAVRRAERAAAALDMAQSENEADSARLSIMALATEQPVVIDGDEVVLTRDHPFERSINAPIELVLPGLLVLRVHPESAAAARATAVATARRELADALAAAGAADLAAARERLDRSRALTDRLARATDRVADILVGTTIERLRDDLAAVQARHDRDRATLAALPGAAPGDPHDPGDRSGERIGPPPEGSREQQEPVAAGTGEDAGLLRGRAGSAAEELAGLAARAGAVRATLTETRLAHARADSLLAAARRELTAARERLARLRATEDDDALAVALAKADGERQHAQRRLATAESALAGVDLQEIRIRRDGNAAAVRSAGDRVGALRDERLRIEARLDQSGRQGRYEALESARGAREHAERKLASVRRRAAAARLLHETLQAHRAAAKRRYVAPFVAAIRRLGTIVYGPGLDVEVSETLTIEARVLDGERIAYDALSTGAKEQLAILTRLAVATIVDAHQGVPVVIDDALGYSDPGRLRRMTAAFSLVGAHAQVILLTCTPGRYDGIVGAEVIRLDEPSAVRSIRAAG